MHSSKKYTCAIARSASILGDKWNLLILRDIILNKKSRFKDFMSSKEKIATNVLTKKLNILLEEGFIKKLLDNKLLTVRAAENVVRLLPPLNVTKQEINLGLKIIDKVCKNYK